MHQKLKAVLIFGLTRSCKFQHKHMNKDVNKTKRSLNMYMCVYVYVYTYVYVFVFVHVAYVDNSHMLPACVHDTALLCDCA